MTSSNHAPTIRGVLAGHYLTNLAVDDESGEVIPLCACGDDTLGQHADVSAAIAAWSGHVTELIDAAPAPAPG